METKLDENLIKKKQKQKKNKNKIKIKSITVEQPVETDELVDLAKIIEKKFKDGIMYYHFNGLINEIKVSAIIFKSSLITNSISTENQSTPENYDIKYFANNIYEYDGQTYVIKKQPNIKSIYLCLKEIQLVFKTNIFYDTKLVNQDELHEEKLKSIIIPFKENEKCCVCNENTRSVTLCNHYVCLQCRCKIKEKKCPICRDDKLDTYPEDDLFFDFFHNGETVYDIE